MNQNENSEPTFDLNRQQAEAIVLALRYYAHCLVCAHPEGQVPQAVMDAARYRWELATDIEAAVPSPKEVVL